MTFPAGNNLVLSNGTATGLIMPNPIVGGFTFIGKGRSPYDTQWNHWQPRIGVSYALDNKTVIRGGYGVNYGFAFELGGNTTFTQTSSYLPAVSSATPGHPTGSPNPAFFNGSPYGSGDPFQALTQPTG